MILVLWIFGCIIVALSLSVCILFYTITGLLNRLSTNELGIHLNNITHERIKRILRFNVAMQDDKFETLASHTKFVPYNKDTK